MQTSSILATLLLAVLPLAAAQDCFCPGGGSVPDPEKMIQLTATTQTTCGTLEEEASNSFSVQAHGCNYYQYYAYLCGCGEPEEPIQLCSLCQDGSDGSELAVQRMGKSSECNQYAIEAKFDPFLLGCGYYNFLGSLCGCVRNKPPFEGCPLCRDGSEPPLSSQEVRVPGVEGGTCENANFFTRYVQEPNTRDCVASQATLGKFCGCDPESQPKGSCPLCSGGMTITNDPAPTFKYLSKNGETQIHQSGNTCLEAEMLAHKLSKKNEVGQQTCSGFREQLSEACCKAPPPEEPTSGVEGEESAEEAVPGDSSGAFGYSSRAAGLCAVVFALWELLL